MKTAISFEGIIGQIRQKKDTGEIADGIINSTEFIEKLIAEIKTEKTALKFSYEKILRNISKKHPELIYPYFDEIAEFLDSENNFIKWGAVFTIANLASVDSENKFERLFRKYYSPVTGPVMITASNIIRSSPVIAGAKPLLADKIAREILNIQNGKYINRGEVSPECKNIVCGQAIDSFALFYDKIKNKKAVNEFVNAQINNSRPAVKKKAGIFIKKFMNINKKEK